MLNKDFANFIAAQGLSTQKDMRRVDLNNRDLQFAEFKLIEMQGFDEDKLLQAVMDETAKKEFTEAAANVDPQTISMLQTDQWLRLLYGGSTPGPCGKGSSVPQFSLWERLR